VIDRRTVAVTAEQVDVDALAQRVLTTLEQSRSTWTRWHVLAETERVTRPLRLRSADERDRLVEVVRQRVCGPESRSHRGSGAE